MIRYLVVLAVGYIFGAKAGRRRYEQLAGTYKAVTESPAGSVWAVGTEIHLVNRLARQVQPDRTVLSLDQFGCLCSTMFRVSPNHLLWTLEGLVEGTVHNRIVVPADRKQWTKVALDRMLSIS